MHIVYRADTTTTLASSSNPSLHGTPVTITAAVEAVAPGGGIPVGSVELFDGSASLGTCALDGSGKATFTTNDLTIGSHSLSAVYTGTYYNHSGSTSAQLTQLVSPNLPVAGFSANVTGGTAPLAVQFTDTSTASPTSWQWNFGDGTPNSTVQNPLHIYESGDLYTVTLTATNADGSGSVQQTRMISVQGPPPATYDMDEFYPRATLAPLPSPSPIPTLTSTAVPVPEPSESPIVSGVPSATSAAAGQPQSGFPWWIAVAGVVMLGLAGAAYFLAQKK